MISRLVALALVALLVGCASTESTDADMAAETQPDDGDLVGEFVLESGDDEGTMDAIDIDEVSEPAEGADDDEGDDEGAAEGDAEGVETAPTVGVAGTTIGRTFHVRNDPDRPVPSWVVDSLSSMLTTAGARPASGNACEVVVVFRERPLQKWESPEPATGTHTRTTSLWSPRQTGGESPPWHAVIEVIVQESDDAGASAPLREIRMRVAKESIDRATFTRAEVGDLWKVLEVWAAGYPSPPSVGAAGVG